MHISTRAKLTIERMGRRCRGRMVAAAAILASAWLAVSLVSPAMAQTAAATATQGNGAADPAALAEKVDILTRASSAIDLPLNEPRPVDLGLVDVPGVEKRLTEGVTAKAYSRYVEVGGRKIGQVVLTGVEKNGRQESLTATNFTAQFDLAKPQIESAAELKVNGSRGELRAALERLAAQPEKKESDNRAVSQTDAAPQGGGSEPSRNEQASGYQTPSAVNVPAPAEESIRVIAEGCPIRIDMGQQRAIQQSKSVTTVNGTIKDESACSDGAESFVLQRSYSVCSDKVDMEALTATAQFKWFYVDAGGATVDVSDCGPDTDKVFAIVEDLGSCTIDLDYEKLTATPRARLVYRNVNSQEVQVRGCEASQSKPAVPLVATTSGCSIRHDFAGGQSYQQGTFTYTLDGVTYQAGGCRDNNTKYAHNKIYTDAGGGYICQPVIDNAAQTVALQSRVQITVDGLSQFITDCTPDSTTTAVVTTTEGCTDPSTWTHDLAAGVSYRHERFYFVDAGVRKYITGCQKSAVTYNHQHQVTGYQNHDGQLFSYPLTTVYITPESGRYNIKVSEVLDGAVQQPYELTGIDQRPNGTSTYAGCNAYRQTDKVEVWKRADDTNYEKKIGAGAVVGPVDVCVTTLADTRRLTTGWYWYASGPEYMCDTSGTFEGGGGCSWVYRFTQHYTQEDVQKHEVKNTETGQVVSTTCQFMHGNWMFYQGPGTGAAAVYNDQFYPSVYGARQAQTLTVPPCPF